ncbi:MAG: hypothetical protein LBU24_01860 [Methanocalculaceae archaeon]|nr:hypothetical protein [Methanocalculaceae archaeon]
MEKQGIVTLEDYFATKYENNRELRTLSAVIGILVSLVSLVGKYSAISIVLVWLFGIEHWQALLIAGWRQWRMTTLSRYSRILVVPLVVLWSPRSHCSSGVNLAHRVM